MSEIVARYHRSYANMAFQASPELFADRRAVAEAITILRGFFDGSERGPGVRDALDCLRTLYGSDMDRPAFAFLGALDASDEAERMETAASAFTALLRVLRGRPGLLAGVAG